MVLFFVVYFWILKHPLRPPFVMPLTAVDQLLEFCPATLPLYLSLWVYVSLAPALLISRRELWSYVGAAVVLATTGLTIFLLWPTTVPVPAVDWSKHPAFIFLKSVDASGNACPSLHVAFAVFTALWLHRLLRQMSARMGAHIFNWLWCLGILYSTVATRQHVTLDVLAGALIGVAVGIAHVRWLRSFARPQATESNKT